MDRARAFYGACLGDHLLPVFSGSPSFFRQCDHRVTTGGEESHTLSVAGFAVGSLIMPGMAADMTLFDRAPLQALPFNWTGVYIGLSAVRGRTSNQAPLAQAAGAVLWGPLRRLQLAVHAPMAARR